ncbi:unnamed protein product [Blepharisma stoltei]|uniref:Uncharacterized protein n=1 Tax=Blepharisma stoltei TaxID=1481888 RepID=A0AAU9ISB3_9CILI|nr:unnamed protein product [Blepharisma stoltei]
MASYSFTSEPRVVANRTEKYKPEERMTMNLMYDKRVYRGHVHDIHNIRADITPQEQERIHLEKEKETKQLQMMQSQLDAFKNSKVKQTPYDIRPAAAARIEVDLTYFLTDQKDIKPDEAEINTQTDAFLPKPPSPKYVPKKTGIDVTTQIEDGDLFNFDEAVEPILNVLVYKTLEQSLLEVEEETEFDTMETYKEQNKQRKHEEQAEWAKEVNEEIERIKKKDAEVQKGRTKYMKTENLVIKFQNLNLAKTYLSQLIPKTVRKIYEDNVYPEYFPHLLHTHYLPFLLDKTVEKIKTKEAASQVPDSILSSAATDLINSRKELIKSHKIKAAKQKLRLLNFSDDVRFVRFLYVNPRYIAQSEFTMRIETKIKGEEYRRPEEDSLLLKDIEPQEEQSSMSIHEEEKSKVYSEKPLEEPKEIQRPEWAKFTTIQIDNFKRIGFALANHPFLDTPKDGRKYGVKAEIYSENGHLIGRVDINSSQVPQGFKVYSSCRNASLKTSDDEKIVIKLEELPDAAHHIILYASTVRNIATEFKHAKYHIFDFETSQDIDSKFINAEEFQPLEEQGIAPLYLAYKISKTEWNPRLIQVTLNPDNTPNIEYPKTPQHWVLEIFNLPVNKPFEGASKTIQETIEEGYKYLNEFGEELSQYKTRKLIEEAEYKKLQMEEASKKKKKRNKNKEKQIVAPWKMAEYVPRPYEYPNTSFGPFHLDIRKISIEEINELVKSGTDQELLNKFENGFCLKIRNHELKEPLLILKAKTLCDLKILEYFPPPPPPEPEMAEITMREED